MAVSTVDGTISEAVPGRSAAGVRFFKKIVFDVDGGGTRTVAKAVVHSDLAGHLQRGARGRFYLFTAIDHRGIHGFRDSSGQAICRFPRNNERLMLAVVILMGLWVGIVLFTAGGLPILPTLLLLLGVPAWFLFRRTRNEAMRQFEADQAPAAPSPAAVPGLEAAPGA